MQRSDFSEFLALATHRKPTLRVLEIGAWAGCNASIILPHLVSVSAERMYSLYIHTDKSSDFFTTAKERFKVYPAMEYATLDISADPLEQGSEPESFDLIIACNVLHTTPRSSTALNHIRNLHRPVGRLLIQDLSPLTKWVNYILGVLPDWRVGENDGRGHRTPRHSGEMKEGAGKCRIRGNHYCRLRRASP